MDWLDPELGLLEFGPMSLVFRVNRVGAACEISVTATVRVYLGQRLRADMLIILKKEKAVCLGKGGPFNEPDVAFYKKNTWGVARLSSSFQREICKDLTREGT